MPAQSTSVNQKQLRFVKLHTFLLTLVVSGCSSHGYYKPDPQLARGVLNDLSFSGSVSLINIQTSTAEQALAYKGIVVNYHDFTQSVVDGLGEELRRLGTEVSNDAPNQVTVAVTYVGAFNRAIAIGTVSAEINCNDWSNEKIESGEGSFRWYGSGATKPLDAAFRELIQRIGFYLDEHGCID